MVRILNNKSRTRSTNIKKERKLKRAKLTKKKIIEASVPSKKLIVWYKNQINKGFKANQNYIDKNVLPIFRNKIVSYVKDAPLSTPQNIADKLLNSLDITRNVLLQSFDSQFYLNTADKMIRTATMKTTADYQVMAMRLKQLEEVAPPNIDVETFSQKMNIDFFKENIEYQVPMKNSMGIVEIIGATAAVLAVDNVKQIEKAQLDPIEKFYNDLKAEVIENYDDFETIEEALSKTEKKLKNYSKDNQYKSKMIAENEVYKVTSTVAQESSKKLGAGLFYWKTKNDHRVTGNPAGLYPKAKIRCFDITRNDIGNGKGVYSFSEGAEDNMEKNLFPSWAHYGCRCVPVPLFDGVNYDAEKKKTKL